MRHFLEKRDHELAMLILSFILGGLYSQAVPVLQRVVSATTATADQSKNLASDLDNIVGDLLHQKVTFRAQSM